MYVPYNPNPLSKNVDDCVIRALTKVLDCTWDEAFMAATIYAFIYKDLQNSNYVLGKLLRAKGFIKRPIPDTCPDCYTIAQFAHDNKEGAFVVGTGNHVVAVVDGDYYDSRDSGYEIPIFYWRRKYATV